MPDETQMNSDEIWRAIDEQRADLANLLESLDDEQWTSASLCEGWQVRDVAAHLTHSHMSPSRVIFEAVKSGFRFDPMIQRLGREDTRPRSDVIASLRAMIGSRRHIVGSSEIDPLTDLLVHGQDIAVPLGIVRPMPKAAAVACANHLWRMRFPFRPASRLKGIRLVASDADFAVGDGYQVQATIRDILMMLTGRRVAASAEVDAHRKR